MTMNIYFSGIGGVGLGPLAEIASDAGHIVQGSDQHKSLMTGALEKRGIRVGYDQSGDFFEACNTQNPIDWVVYTAGLPPTHPELVRARELNIKTSKRDELLAHIIQEKQLQLIAVAGTHGKTTTTAMMVWTMQQLNIPVSYSIGTTINFGPSGKFDPASRYFVYECDEFDRNFLHFYPRLSLITSLDYDHPDTYPTKLEYDEAFRSFLAQSEHVIVWQHDNASLEATGDMAWVLNDDEAWQLPLAGRHNRQNATLVAKAMEYLGEGTDEAVRSALTSFPGTSRRFEKIGDNLYSDYGHHPVEIAATLQLARELSDDVVLIYQPHQNVRQHSIRHEYTDCFDLASEVYWLPTYLSREDPSLPILSPEELSKNVSSSVTIHVATLNDDLWNTITDARDTGKLVLCMGAGTIDGWVRSHAAGSA